MPDYKIISCDTHIVEPPDTYIDRIEPAFRERAPRLVRSENAQGREYDAWFLDGQELITLGAFTQTALRFEDPSRIDFVATWEDVRKGAYDPHEMVKDLEQDGIWGAYIYSSIGACFTRIEDSKLLTAICRAYTEAIADFIKPYPSRLKAPGFINVDDVDDACEDLERCAELGLTGALIPVYPLPDRPYRHPIYDRLWWTAAHLEMPLIMHSGYVRHGIPGLEQTTDFSEYTPAGRSNHDYWVRYSLAAMIFAGVFDRYPGLKMCAGEHELSWIPYWLARLDETYKERGFYGRGWRSKRGMIPSDYWHENMFATFIEDHVGVQRLRDIIGVENMVWGNDYPHSEATWPKSMEYLDSIFAGVPDEDRYKVTSENAVRLLKFEV